MQLQAFVNAAQPTRRALVSGIASAAVPAIAQARVRGAAELDAEYYARRAFEKVTNTSPDVFDARQARAAMASVIVRALAPLAAASAAAPSRRTAASSAASTGRAAAATGAARARRASKTSGLVLVTFSNALRA